MRRDLWAVFLMALFLGLMATRAMAAEAPPGLDLNRATMQELMQLPGVGPKRAEEIVRYRLQHPFRRTSDLMRIKGIGTRTFVKLRPLVRVDAAEANPAALTKPETPTS
ncbi:MAG: helix-hairpin-helix domain-containing protein [Deltaproteobacteria bacterium]|nr:helix-hairpin-helix domain-containing protein [Deltaproteobacteria bacterium]